MSPKDVYMSYPEALASFINSEMTWSAVYTETIGSGGNSMSYTLPCINAWYATYDFTNLNNLFAVNEAGNFKIVFPEIIFDNGNDNDSSNVSSLTDIRRNNVIYNLQGLKVGVEGDNLPNLPAGIYIINGKKIAVK